jgi:hypothetical protein
MRSCLCLAIFSMLLACAMQGETPVEHSNETRLQLDFQVPAAALATFLPPGWTSNPATEGAAKDCNLRVIFIDRVTINDPEGFARGKGTNRLVFLAAPVKDPSGASVQLVIGGITQDPRDVPGPFGNYLLSTTFRVDKSLRSENDFEETQDWIMGAASGETFEMHIAFQRGTSNKRNMADTKYYSAKNPSLMQISRQEQVLDIMRNVTTNPVDKVHSFSFKAKGGVFAKLFDGTEKVLSWDNVLWLNRTILVP